MAQNNMQEVKMDFVRLLSQERNMIEVTWKILEYLDDESLLAAEQVSPVWRYASDAGYLWKKRIEQKVCGGNQVWKDIIDRKGWTNCLFVSPGDRDAQYYRHLYSEIKRLASITYRPCTQNFPMCLRDEETKRIAMNQNDSDAAIDARSVNSEDDGELEMMDEQHNVGLYNTYRTTLDLSKRKKIDDERRRADLAASVTPIKTRDQPSSSSIDNAELQKQQEKCALEFDSWGEEDQVAFVTQLLSKMCHAQHGQINSYLKPMLQRDFISALPAKGLDHVAEKLLGYLDADSLASAELVCKEWYRVIAFGMLWKKLIEYMVRTDELWKGLAERRGCIGPRRPLPHVKLSGTNLKNSPKSMHNLILGCLLDLCENSKTVSHIRVWRGKDDKSAAHLFCDIWRKEEHDLGVVRTEAGALADTVNPLMGKLQQEEVVRPLPANNPSQAIVDVVENMRAKIHALFCKMGYTELPGMTTEDYVTLTIIEQYLNLKMGEVWTEIMSELEQENVRPVSPDQEAIETIHRAITEDAKSVILIQHDLLRAQNDQDLTDEKEFYAEIRDNHRQQEKAINDWAEYIARTSKHPILKAAKQKQEQSVEASRIATKHKPGTVVHKVDQGGLNTTIYSGRKVIVESTPLNLTGGKLANYDATIGTLKPRERTIIYE